MAWHYTRWHTRPLPSSAHRRPRPRCPHRGRPVDQPCFANATRRGVEASETRATLRSCCTLAPTLGGVRRRQRGCMPRRKKEDATSTTISVSYLYILSYLSYLSRYRYWLVGRALVHGWLVGGGWMARKQGGGRVARSSCWAWPRSKTPAVARWTWPGLLGHSSPATFPSPCQMFWERFILVKDAV